MSSKVAFITGSAKRIGACVAEHLHRLGFNLVLHCNQSLTSAKILQEKLNYARADSAALVTGDLCEMSQLEEIANQAIEAFGRLDVLINNASAFYPTPIGAVQQADWHVLMGSNTQAPLFLSQLCQKQLKQNQGVIINMVDIHAERPLKDHTLYCMAKAALATMTQSLAQELAPEVRVNGVSPGAILWPETPLTESQQQEVLSEIPAARLGSPQDIADTIAFLIKASYITGQIIAVDGGRSIASGSVA